MPLGRNAPSDWPADAGQRRPRWCRSGRPCSPWRLVTSWPSIVPTARSVLRIGQLDRRPARRARARRRAAGSARWSKCFVELVVLRHGGCVRGSSSANSGPTRTGAQVEAVGLPVLDRAVDVEQLAVADRLVERCGSRARRGTRAPPARGTRRRSTTNSGLPVKRARSSGFCVATPTGQVSRWQTRIRMQPRHHERRGREAVLLGAEQRGDDDVAAGLHLAVDLHDDAVAHAVEHEGLLGLGEADLPRRSGVLERVERARARCRRRGRRRARRPRGPSSTPAATAPMPDWLTSLTCTRASGFARLRSKISCLRSSIE